MFKKEGEREVYANEEPSFHGTELKASVNKILTSVSVFP